MLRVYFNICPFILLNHRSRLNKEFSLIQWLPQLSFSKVLHAAKFFWTVNIKGSRSNELGNYWVFRIKSERHLNLQLSNTVKKTVQILRFSVTFSFFVTMIFSFILNAHNPIFSVVLQIFNKSRYKSVKTKVQQNWLLKIETFSDATISKSRLEKSAWSGNDFYFDAYSIK